jgi:hypothetical protein
MAGTDVGFRAIYNLRTATRDGISVQRSAVPVSGPP